MKKLLCLGVALTFVSACTTFEADLDKAAEKRAESRAEVRAEIGCQFTDDHDAYRRCVLATYHNNKPKTYAISQTCSGQPLAIVSQGAPITTGAQTKTVVTETVVTRTQQSAPVTTTTTTTTAQVPVTPSVVQSPLPTAPVAQQQFAVAPAQVRVVSKSPVVSSCNSPKGNCYYQSNDVYQMEVPVAQVETTHVVPCPSCTQAPVVVQQPKAVTVERTETVVEKPVEVVPMPQPLPEKTWWETYQEEKQPAQPKVVCPCPDPNDPCPQCVTK